MELVNNLKYSLHVIFHPFDGFWDLKHEKRGSIKAAFVIMVLLSAVYIMKRQFVGYVFNTNEIEFLNVFVEVLGTIIPYVLWCISNWCYTTLMDGEGSLKDIFIATAYAVVPLIVVNVPLIIVSNFMIEEEAAFYQFFDKLAMIWAGLLIFFGTMVTHQYSIKKTIITCILVVVGMGIIVFISLLFFYLIQSFQGFIVNIYKEITFRIY